MKLPGADRAVVDIVKLRDYCLSPVHPRGRHKARVFARMLGLTQDRAEDLRQMLLAAAGTEDAVEGPADQYGQRYGLDFEVETANRIVTIRSAWIIRTAEDFPRFTSCFVLKEDRE